MTRINPYLILLLLFAIYCLGSGFGSASEAVDKVKSGMYEHRK